MIRLLLFNRWSMLTIIAGSIYLWLTGLGDAANRAFPGLGDEIATHATAIAEWLARLSFVPFEALAARAPEPYTAIAVRWSHSLWGHAFWLALIFIVVTTVWRYRSTAAHDRPYTNEKKRRRTQRPGRIPFLDDPKRALPIGHDQQGREVKANIQNSNVFITAGTRSGKSAVMRHLADGDEAVLFGLFDISLPTIARMRYWQEQSRQGKLLDAHGRPRPVVIWRPNPQCVEGWPKLQLCGGDPLEAISRIQHAFLESAGSTGDQRSKARDVGVELFKKAIADHLVPCLDMLIDGWRRESVNPKRDREVRVSCARWASKVAGMKEMLGSAEGPDGIDPLELCARRGKLAMEVNNFAVAEAAGAFGPLIVGLYIWLVNASPVPCNIGFDEGNQLGKRMSGDLVKIYTACGGRDGRACLCCQMPLDFKDVSPNADVVVLGGFGPGASAERKWAADIAGLDPDDFKKHERNVFGRIMRRIGRLGGLMNLECYVVHEGVTEGVVTIDNPFPEMQHYLRHVDWPENRAKIAVPPGMVQPDPDDDFDPLPPEGGSKPTGRVPHSVAGTAATARGERTRKEQQEVLTQEMTGTIVGEASQVVLDQGRDGTVSVLNAGPLEPWVRSEDAKRWWKSLSGTARAGTERAMWLWTGPRNQANGRPKSSRLVSNEELAKLRAKNPNARRSQSCLVYPELYEEAGCPNGKPWPGCSYDHLSHSNDPTCPGGAECIHVLDVNPWNIEPVTPAVQAERRDAQRALHNEWRIAQGLEPLQWSIDKATEAKLSA